MNYLYLFVSIILYISIPNEYNFSLAVIYLIIFLLSFIYTIKKYKISIVSFYSIFSFSFFISHFIVPVFGFPFYPIELIYRYPIDTDYILKGELLALLAYCSMNSGVCLFKIKNKEQKLNSIKFRIELVESTKYIFILLFGYFLYVNIDAMGYDYGMFNEKVFGARFMSTFIELIIYVYILYFMKVLYEVRNKGLKLLFTKYILLLISIVFIVYIYTNIGERGILIKVLLPILIGYDIIVKKIPKKVLFSLIIIGVVFMNFIRDTRNDGSYGNYLQNRNYELPVYLDQTTDLTCATMTMCLGLEYTDKHGYLNGSTLLKEFFAPIPFFPSIINDVFYDGKLKSTGRILSDEVGLREESGVGTSAVVDIFMNFGVIGVIIFFVLFGYIISLIEQRKYDSIYSLYVYLLIMFFAIYIPRDSLFSIIRPLLWGYVLGRMFIKRNKLSPISIYNN